MQITLELQFQVCVFLLFMDHQVDQICHILNFLIYIEKKKKIALYNYGNHSRDFTYITDSVDIIEKLIKIVKKKKKLLSGNFFDVVNVACGKKIHINHLVKLLEKNFNSKIRVKYIKLQKGDVKNTFSDTKKLKKYLGKINHTKF